MKNIFEFPGLPAIAGLFLLCCAVAPLSAQNNNMGIGTTAPDASAILDITSTTKGLLIPRLTDGQQSGLSGPSGLLIYNTDQGRFNYYNGSWQPVGLWKANGNTVFYNTGNVGIGTTTPQQPLSVIGAVRSANTSAESNYMEMGHGGANGYINMAGAGDMDFRFDLTRVMRLQSYGALSINTLEPENAYLRVVAPAGDFRGGQFENNNSSGGSAVYVNNLGGGNAVYIVNGIAAKPGGGPWSSTSDARLKTDIQAYRDGLAQVRAIRPVTYRYNELSGYSTEPTYVGIIAQEVQRIAPYMVLSNDEYLGVDPNAFTYMLINAVRELDEQVQSQQQIIDTQQAKIEAIEKALAKAGISLD